MPSAFLDELSKLGVAPELVSDEEAAHAYDQYVKARDSDITPAQAGRWGLVGAGAGMASSALSSKIKGSTVFSPETMKRVVEEGGKKVEKTVPIRFGRMRAAAAAAAAGAMMGAATPWVRNYLDQQARLSTLNRYMGQSPGEVAKVAFTDTGYGGTGGFVNFHMESPGPPFSKKPVEVPHLNIKPRAQGSVSPAHMVAGLFKGGAAALTPASRLASTRMVGSPRLSAPGPSIHTQAAPVRLGPGSIKDYPLPGTTKTGEDGGYFSGVPDGGVIISGDPPSTNHLEDYQVEGPPKEVRMDIKPGAVERMRKFAEEQIRGQYVDEEAYLKRLFNTMTDASRVDRLTMRGQLDTKKYLSGSPTLREQSMRTFGDAIFGVK